jgi:hypothetical protein
MTDNLKELLTDVAIQQTLRKAQRRKAVAEALEEHPDILSELVSDLSSTFEQVQQETRPPQESSPDSESHWASRLHPDWTEAKLEALEELEINYLRRAPTLSPQDLEDIAQET